MSTVCAPVAVVRHAQVWILQPAACAVGVVRVRLVAADLEIGQVVRREFRELVDSDSDDVVFDAPVIGIVEAERTVRTVRLRGRLGTAVSLMCSRCLSEYRQRLDIVLKEEFALEPVPERARGELTPDDFLLPLGPDQTLDASEVIRQHLLLAMPLAPVCRPDCAGLCPRCGANLHGGPCGCEVEEIDVRLAPLLKLKLDK